ncbi:tetratricopeptide repeat protein [Methanolobus psychrotolerans]|uniref:tetratricopeptide repeat protein n=1 Tax=Methanolobus psychrotolerans TaxID=1874706 RepID=UPI000B91CA49|nr:tetratricopeptide repeat protein [Methanolobus psychrotolerans]
MKKKTSEECDRWIEQGVREKDPERKMHYFDLALQLNPNNPGALNNKGMLLHRKGKFHEAIECYDKILNQYNMSGSVPALYNKSLALKELGRNEAALNFMNKALKQQPDNDKIKGHIEKLTLDMEEKGGTRATAFIPTKKLAVNQTYTQWEPPAVSTLLAQAMNCSKGDIKYHKGCGEDLIKEKIIQDNLNLKVYACKSCKFQKNGICHHTDTKAMKVSQSAICRNFKHRNKKL